MNSSAKNMSNIKRNEIKSDSLSVHNAVEYGDRQDLAKLMSADLANVYTLYLKTQSIHWNVVGPMFYSLHKLTEAQYEDMALAIDAIAERIRALGFVAPGSFRQFIDLSVIEDHTDNPDAQSMIQQLIDDNETCSRALRATVNEAEKVADVKTADLLTARIGQHEENAWMLRAILG